MWDLPQPGRPMRTMRRCSSTTPGGWVGRGAACFPSMIPGGRVVGRRAGCSVNACRLPFAGALHQSAFCVHAVAHTGRLAGGASVWACSERTPGDERGSGKRINQTSPPTASTGEFRKSVRAPLAMPRCPVEAAFAAWCDAVDIQTPFVRLVGVAPSAAEAEDAAVAGRRPPPAPAPPHLQPPAAPRSRPSPSARETASPPSRTMLS